MKTLNLANEADSDIRYKKTKYTDGQVSIELNDIDVRGINEHVPLIILTRFNSYEDLFYLLSATDVLKNWNKNNLYVIITCFFGQRSDARFKPFQSFDLKIITDIINSQNYSQIVILEPHSSVLPALLDRCKTMPDEVFFNYIKKVMSDEKMNDFTLISTDANGYKRTAPIADKFQLPLVPAIKVRNEKGEPVVDVRGNVEGKVCVIYDDYCDGGRTFISLAEQLKNLGASRVVLAVVHGLFSYGLEPLMKNIDLVITTDSIKNIGIMCDGYSTKDYSKYVKQLIVTGRDNNE